MASLNEKLNYAKEGVFSFYKLLKVKPYDVEIAFWVKPRKENSYYHFEKVADIMDDRLVECTVGKDGEFIARYKIKTEKRDDAVLEAQEICDSIIKALGGSFTLKQCSVE